MPTPFTHAFVALAAGTTVAPGSMSARFWILSVACAILPDADVLAFRFGIPYAHVLGHRGFFHSLPFALLLGLLVVLVFFRSEPVLPRGWWILVAYFSLVTASHGILDTFTDGGLGIALLSPFDTTRYFSPFTPIEVAPIGIRAFLSRWGLEVMESEILWVWVPVTAVALLVRWLGRHDFLPQV